MDQLRTVLGLSHAPPHDAAVGSTAPASSTVSQLHDNKLLRQAAAAVVNKDVALRCEALETLLSAAKDGEVGMLELCRLPCFLPSLLDIVAADAPVKGSFLEDPGGLEAANRQAIAAREAATLLLWRLTSCPDVPPIVHAEAPASLHILLGLVVDSSASIRAAASGVLLNLAGLQEVASQAARHSDLVSLLVGMLASSEAQRTAAGRADHTLLEPVITAHAHAAGLLAILARNPACAEQIACADNLSAKLFRGLCFEASSAALEGPGRSLRCSCAEVIRNVLAHGGSIPESSSKVLGSLLRLAARADGAAARALSGSRELLDALEAIVGYGLHVLELSRRGSCTGGGDAELPVGEQRSVPAALCPVPLFQPASLQRQASNAVAYPQRLGPADQVLHLQNAVLAVQVLKVLGGCSGCVPDLAARSTLWEKIRGLAFMAAPGDPDSSEAASMKRAAAQLQGNAAGILALVGSCNAFRKEATGSMVVSASAAELQAAVQYLMRHQPHPVEQTQAHYNYMACLLAAICTTNKDTAAMFLQLFLSTAGTLGALLSLLSPSNTPQAPHPPDAPSPQPFAPRTLLASQSLANPPLGSSLSRFGRGSSSSLRLPQLPALPHSSLSDTSVDLPPPPSFLAAARSSSRELAPQDSREAAAGAQLSTSASMDDTELLQAIRAAQQEYLEADADACAMGIAAALKLLQVICQNADVAKIVATKTDIVSILLKRLSLPAPPASSLLPRVAAAEKVPPPKEGGGPCTLLLSSQAGGECLLAQTLLCLASVLDASTVQEAVVQDALLLPGLVAGLGSSDAGCREHTAALVASMCAFSSFQSLLTSAREGQDVMRLLVEQCAPGGPPADARGNGPPASTRVLQPGPSLVPSARALALLSTSHWPAAVMLGNIAGTLETLAAKLSQALVGISESGYRVALQEARVMADITRTMDALSAAAPTAASSLAAIPGAASMLTDCVDFMLAVAHNLPAPALQQQLPPPPPRPTTADSSMPLFPIPENKSAVELPGMMLEGVGRLGGVRGASLLGNGHADDLGCQGIGGEGQDRGAGRGSEGLAELQAAAQEVRIYAVRTLRHLVLHWRPAGRLLEFEDVSMLKASLEQFQVYRMSAESGTSDASDGSASGASGAVTW